MITNLFSIFDPSISMINITLTISLLIVLIMSNKTWNITNLTNNIEISTVEMLNNEVNFSIGNTGNGTNTIIIITFLLISITNFIALYPQVFSVTSHLTFTLPLSLIFWSSIIIFGWINNTNHIISHLLPQGTPVPLMSFMVIVELSSNIIRPITLFVRLTANLVAGHLLMSLLGNMLINIPTNVTLLISIVPLMLTILELAVSLIQAYVFITLITLYTTETN